MEGEGRGGEWRGGGRIEQREKLDPMQSQEKSQLSQRRVLELG